MLSLFWYQKDNCFSSILHLNLSLISMLCLNYSGILAGIIISVSHGISSVSLFMWAGTVINNTYSRFIDSLFFIDTILRWLFFIFVLFNLSFPLTLNFIGELLMFTSIISINKYYSLIILFSSIITTVFWLFILNRKVWYLKGYSLAVYLVLIHSWFFFINIGLFMSCMI